MNNVKCSGKTLHPENMAVTDYRLSVTVMVMTQLAFVYGGGSERINRFCGSFIKIKCYCGFDTTILILRRRKRAGNFPLPLISSEF